MLRIRCFVVALIGIAAVGGSLVASAQPIVVPLIAHTQAERAGLKRAWFAQVPMDPARAKIKHIKFHSGLLLVITDEGMLHALDAESGLLQWSFAIGDRRYMPLSAGANAKHVAVANTSTLFILDRANGNLVFQHKPTGTPERGPVLTENHVILPLVKGPLEVFPLNEDFAELLTPNYLPASGRMMGDPATSDDTVVWSGDLNRIHGFQFGNAQGRFSQVVPEGVSSSPALFAPHAYMGTAAGYVNAYDAIRGGDVWQFVAGSPVRHQPVALGEVVYVLPQDGGMFAVTADQGVSRWFSPEPVRFVSASPQRVYAIDKLGRLTILDAKSGGRIDTMPLPPGVKPVLNDHSDRLLWYTDGGLLQCLHEPQLAQPHLYIPPKPEPPAKGPAVAPAPEPVPPAEAPGAVDPPAGDVFGPM